MNLRESHVDILHVIGAFVAGGAERFVVDLLGALKDQGLSVGLIVLSSRRDKAGMSFCKELEKRGIPYWCGPTDKIGFHSLFWYLGRLLQIHPHIVHLHTPNTEFAHFLARNFYWKKHLIYRTIHSTKMPNNFWHWKAIRWNHAHISIGCGFAIGDDFISQIKGEFITIENGISFTWPIQTEEHCSAAKTRLGISKKGKHFVNIGRQGGESLETAAKGHDILVKAWRNSCIGMLDCELHLLGDGNLQTQLKLLAQGDPSILFHGVRDDVHDWLLAADCSVMPSRYEGLPIAGIEAIGTGIPCLFSDIKPLRDLQAPVALWSAVDDVEALQSNLIEMAHHKQLVPYNATQQFREHFGMNKTATRYRDSYETGGGIPA